MRGAGCTINDLWDRDIDRQVERTRSRPLAAGTVTPLAALVFLGAQLSLGLAILLQLNTYTQVGGNVGTASLLCKQHCNDMQADTTVGGVVYTDPSVTVMPALALEVTPRSGIRHCSTSVPLSCLRRSADPAASAPCTTTTTTTTSRQHTLC
jgi:hypothetical protein